jgi:4-amino-4-deoxy-L-arabinose transferase-like glycosyltransferase
MAERERPRPSGVLEAAGARVSGLRRRTSGGAGHRLALPGEVAPLSRWVGVVALIQVAALVATSTRYGYHRDEFYFIQCGAHPAFGYPDQPPLVPLLSWAMQSLAPGSLLVLRAPSALAAGLTTVLAALIAREVCGDRRAQVIAAACTACSAFALATGHVVSTTTFDLLSTTALCWLAIRAVRTGSGPCLLAAGAVAGLGVEFKPQVGLVAVVAVTALAIVGPRARLRSRWAAAGTVLAVALAAPYLIWQAQHGWPQATVAANIAGTEEGGRVGFIPFQLIMVSPVLVPVWIVGLIAPFRRPAWRALRFAPITYVGLAVAYLVGDGSAYYLASLYPALLGLGAVPTAAWIIRSRGRRGALGAAVVLSAAVSALIALPLLPERDLPGSATVALNVIPAETVGWPRFVDTVAAAWRRIPAAQRARTAVFADNYGEAGAVDLMGPRRGLPRAYSGHNAFSEWGRPPSTDTYALVLGYDDPRDAEPSFTGCRRLAKINDGVGLDNQEQGLAVMLCRPAASWAILWPRLRHYD